jgi:hypothetical protein
MYQISFTFFGLPLSQHIHSSDLKFLNLIAGFVEDGWSISDINDQKIEEYATQFADFDDFSSEDVSKAVSFLKFLKINKDEFNKLGVDFESHYSGDGEPPMFFGVGTNDDAINSHYAKQHNYSSFSDSTKQIQGEFFKIMATLPPELSELVIGNTIGLWSMHGTS